MKLLDKMGDAMLTKLVPGIDAKANCGQCRRYRCAGCGDRPDLYKTIWGIDLCGNICQWFNCARRTC